MNNAVEVENLRKVYEMHKRNGFFRRTKAEVVSVDNVNFSVPEGQALAFVGPNGAGKSTTIRMLTGILTPSAGYARVLGYVPWKERSHMAYHIGAVFGQRSQLWYHLPASDTFDLLAKIYNLDKVEYRKRRDELVDRFRLGPLLDVPVRKLSLGQRMRAEVAASLLHKPRLLLLDEPTIGLDIHAKQQLRELVSEWNRKEGLTVFLTSHDTGDIENVAERVIIINHGRLVLDDSVENLRRQYEGLSLEEALSHIYGLEVESEETEDVPELQAVG
ncbi:MAG: ATP-binding cassette domain-containing protein [Candidatus Obscuribacterales bacterium]|nr:ATP-binding cassette domain-containing protein [Candidatus Obscuribacterales bacterium]